MKIPVWLRDSFQVTIGLILIGLMAYGTLILVRLVVRSLALLNPNITVAIIAAGATVVVSVISIVVGKLYESRQLIQKEHRARKVPVYEDLIKFMSRILMATKSGTTVDATEMIDFIGKFTQDMMVWGSDDVVAAWTKWRRLAVSQEQMVADPTAALFQYEALVFAIRRDLGHKNKRLEKGDILSMFINDIDQYLPRKNA